MAYLFLALPAIIFVITFHEFAHAITAVWMGDKTPEYMNRTNLNPVNHFDPVGFLAIVITLLTGKGIGWGKPVVINPLNFRNRAVGEFWVAFAGPLSNILLTIISIIIYYFLQHLPVPQAILLFILTLADTSLFLAVFNLLPIPPLDGFTVLQYILPQRLSLKLDKIKPFSIFIFMLFIFTPLKVFLIVPYRLLKFLLIDSIIGGG